MNDIWTIVSIIIIIAPFAIGLAAFAGFWLSRHFYAEPFYEDDDA